MSRMRRAPQECRSARPEVRASWKVRAVPWLSLLPSWPAPFSVCVRCPNLMEAHCEGQVSGVYSKKGNVTHQVLKMFQKIEENKKPTLQRFGKLVVTPSTGGSLNRHVHVPAYTLLSGNSGLECPSETWLFMDATLTGTPSAQQAHTHLPASRGLRS